MNSNDKKITVTVKLPILDKLDKLDKFKLASCNSLRVRYVMYTFIKSLKGFHSISEDHRKNSVIVYFKKSELDFYGEWGTKRMVMEIIPIGMQCDIYFLNDDDLLIKDIIE